VSISDFRAKLSATAIPWQWARFLSWVLAVNALINGWDYTHTPARVTKSLTVVEQMASLHTWGMGFYIGGGLLCVGLLIKRHLAVWIGHFICAVLYLGFTVSTFQAVWEVMNNEILRKQGSIWRAVANVLVFFLLHAVFCVVRGFVPRREIVQ
jgi:hypothetical protein